MDEVWRVVVVALVLTKNNFGCLATSSDSLKQMYVFSSQIKNVLNQNLHSAAKESQKYDDLVHVWAGLSALNNTDPAMCKPPLILASSTQKWRNLS